MKLVQLLARRESGKASYVAFLADIVKKFATSKNWTGKRVETQPVSEKYLEEQGDNTYTPVSYTVPQAIQYFLEHNLEYLQTMLNIDATNASGISAELVVEGKNYGAYTSLELMQLRSILMDNKFINFLRKLPTYDMDHVWTPVEGTNQYQKTPTKFAVTTTEKTPVILVDPNLKNSGGKYTPVQSMINERVHLADRTITEFHGGISPDEVAAMLARREAFLTGVNEALAKVNTMEAKESEFKLKEMFNYIFNG